jgi:hypothetical protein
MQETTMSGASFPDNLAFPEARDTVRIREESLIVEINTLYRDKTNSYVVDRTALLSILDKSAHQIEEKWQDDWTEVAPGIETRRENQIFRTRIGSRSSEHVITGSVRIQASACPVFIKFRSTLEYVDYYDSEFSSCNSTDYWIRYEKQAGTSQPES